MKALADLVKDLPSGTHVQRMDQGRAVLISGPGIPRSYIQHLRSGRITYLEPALDVEQ